MSVIDRIARLAGFERRSAIDPSWSAIAPSVGYGAVLSARAAENLTTVLACSTAIASALASIPALVYRRDADGTRTEAPAHPLAKLTRAGVHGGMSWPEFMEHLIVSALLHGNGLAEVKRNGNGALSGLKYVPWQDVTVSELPSGRLAYDVRERLGPVRRLLEGEVIHLRDRTDDGLIGRSRLSRAAGAIEGIGAAELFARNFVRNGASPSGVIKSTTALSPEQVANLRAQFDERQAGAGNAGRALVLDGGLDWVARQVSPEDAQLLETRKFGVEEICRLFQVPPPLVQDYSHNTFTNSETAGRWFAMFCLAPWARKIEGEFARSVFPTNGPFELELDLTGFLRGDPATRWQAHAIALTNKVLDPDEVRQVEGWNPRPQASL